MDEKNDLQKIKNEYPDFFAKISDDLVDFVFSETTAAQIVDICIRSEVKKNKEIEDVAYKVTLVLLGKLPKENLARALESDAEIPGEIAQKISSEAERIIFSDAPNIEPKTEKPSNCPQTKLEEELKPPPKKDTYREKVE